MKKVIRIFLFALLVGSGTVMSNEAKSQSVDVSFSVFQNSLKPYGRWMNHPSYGQVWRSNTKGFSPYSTGGHWAYTDYGWTWVSDYDWGWAPFHYGRWSYNTTYGWYWVPGYEWAPAWVAWRNNNDYYGWAPLSPGLNISVGVSSYGAIASGRWVFAPHRYITSNDIGRYYVPRTQNVTIIKNTTIVNNVSVRNNVHYVSGPRREDVERVNHTKIQTYKVANSSKPGRTVINNNTVNVYRPVINNNKTVVNNKTTVNKNSNNTTVNKNSNNTKVTKNNQQKTINKTTNENVNNKTTNNNNNKPVPEKPHQKTKPVKKPADNGQPNINRQKVKQEAQNKAAMQQHKQQVKQQQAKRKQPANNGNKQK
ncbi:MAG: DUF6600 domain-containing protein [Parafilimonas sp.]